MRCKELLIRETPILPVMRKLLPAQHFKSWRRYDKP